MTVEEAIQIVEEDEDFDEFPIDLKIPTEGKEMAPEIEDEEYEDEEYDAYEDKAEYDDDDDDDDD